MLDVDAAAKALGSWVGGYSHIIVPQSHGWGVFVVVAACGFGQSQTYFSDLCGENCTSREYVEYFGGQERRTRDQLPGTRSGNTRPTCITALPPF